MSLTSASPAATTRVRIEPFRLALLWLTGASGALVLVEPSPYEVVSLATILVFALTGLHLSPRLLPLAALLVLLNLGYTIAVLPVAERERTLQWVAVSWYLSISCVCFAAVLAENTQRRMEALIGGLLAGAAIAAIAAIGGYFRLFGGVSELFLRYGRAQGTFNDPNVLGAFLCAPALFALQRVLTARGRTALYAVALLGLAAIALLLSFSRGAWGQFAFSAALVIALTFVTSAASERLRIVVIAAAGGVALLALLGLLLSLGPVAELFQQRASLSQSYDAGPLGRFGRHALGFVLALDHPLGIGPLQFNRYFPEDPHNSYLNAFVSGGWLGGFAYLALIGTTLILAGRMALVATPWRPAFIVVFATVLGTAGESVIIDSDHWRHYFLHLGLLWGLMAATAAWTSRHSPAAAARARSCAERPRALQLPGRSVAQPG